MVTPEFLTGPHRLATIREFTGILSPCKQRISMSESSRSAKAFSPSSSDALEWNRPPAVQPAFLAKLRSGPVKGLLDDTNPDNGAVFLGLS
ncbi:hypothetical protein HYQ46_003213 [Verticillium longisporum]|nr:hypothetical protein HYQ46_003213 [Verticillium longisporum]